MKYIYRNVYLCLIINQDIVLNQHSKYEKIQNRTWYQTGHEHLPFITIFF